MHTCIVTSLQMSLNGYLDISRQKKSAFPHSLLSTDVATTLFLHAVTCLSLWVQFSSHNNQGFRGWYVGLDRFPSGKSKHLTGHIYSGCSTCVLHHGMTQCTISHAEWLCVVPPCLLSFFFYFILMELSIWGTLKAVFLSLLSRLSFIVHIFECSRMCGLLLFSCLTAVKRWCFWPAGE